MSINTLYKNYFQKSKTFLFPLLRIPKGPLSSPTTTFLSWEGYYSIQDTRLICSYQVIDSIQHAVANTHIFSHPLFEDKFDLEDNNRIYIFDLSIYKNDYELFLEGRYSKLSEPTKIAIVKYFGIGSPEHEYLDSFLYPEKYYELYAKLIDVTPSVLKEVGELCDHYDPKRENLKIIQNSLQSYI